MVNLGAEGKDDQVAGQVLTARLLSQLQDLAGAGHHLLGDADELAIFVALLRVALCGGSCAEWFACAVAPPGCDAGRPSADVS
jgi:hypothetical protein